MTKINWNPTPGEMRRWALILAVALGLVGCLFYFVEWGIFAHKQNFAKFLWSFGVVALVTGLTGTKLGLPAYWAWMGFVFVVSSVIGYTTLALVYFLVVTPMAFAGRIIGRDRLQLRAKQAQSFWHNLSTGAPHRPERQF